MLRELLKVSDKLLWIIIIIIALLGEDSLNCKYLAIKRTNRNDAKNGVSNIDIYKCKNKPPSTYKKLGA